MDAKNSPIQHTIVFGVSGILVLVLHYLFDIEWTNVFARVAYLQLFLILLIGPVVKLKKPHSVSNPLLLPWSWRGELGIWFCITSIVHFVVVLSSSSLARLIRIGGSGYSLANFIGLVALILTIFLAISSFGKVIAFLEGSSWKWLHSFAYVIFYLVTAHMLYFQYFSSHGEPGPDWFGVLGAILASIIVLLQFSAFSTVVLRNKKHSSA